LDWVFGGKMKSTCSRNAAEEAFRNQHGHDYTFSSPNQKATQKYKYPLFSLTKLHMIAFLENLLRRAEKTKQKKHHHHPCFTLCFHAKVAMEH